MLVGAGSTAAMLEVSVLHDRNPLFVQLSDGGVRNGYTLKILNKTARDARFPPRRRRASPAAKLSIVGFDGGEPAIDVVPDNLRALKV